MSETLIKVEGVSKKFCRNLKKSLWYGLQDLGREITGQRHGGNGELRADEFWAVRDVSFELKRGECLGLIGRNGAGKTTLLRMLNGLIKPDSGRIEMRGRVGALIALGAGFNPILTGRENIYVNASVLGLSKKEIDEKIDKIIDFADITEFIDMPVQSYSSGMTVRLGFSVATALHPDILLLDEVLAVGDVGFMVKCGNRIRELATSSAVVFVSHNMQYVSSFCSRAILMAEGQNVIDSIDPATAIQRYQSLAAQSEETSGSGGASVEWMKLNILGAAGSAEQLVLDQGVSVELEFELKISENCFGAFVTLAILDESLNGIISYPLLRNSEPIFYEQGLHHIRVPLGVLDLSMGKYSFLLAVNEKDTRKLMLRHQCLCPFQVHAPNANSTARIIRPVSPSRILGDE